jgi:ribonuclease P protein component
MAVPGDFLTAKNTGFAGISAKSTPLSTGVDRAFWKGDPRTRKPTLRTAFVSVWCSQKGCGELGCRTLSILPFRGPGGRRFLVSCLRRPPCEADLPAQRATSEAEARFPCPHVHPCRPDDPETPPGEGPEAALRLTATAVQRRHRLSRSRDFDAVYRHGRSVSTRFLVLYWFPRDDEGEPRLGIAVPKGSGSAVERNRVKRRLREAWRARLGQVPAGRDYVLIARPALGEALSGHDATWLGERVDEVLGKAAA